MATEEHPKPKPKGKLSLPIIIGGGIALFVIAFGLGLALRMFLTEKQPEEAEEAGTVISFTTIYSGPGNYGLLGVNVHFSSAETAAKLKDKLRERAVRNLRRAIDLVFRTAGAGAFTRNGNALVPSRRALDRLLSALEAQVRDLSAELNTMEDRLVVAVTIYYLPD
jgi:hypothetical protein